MRLVRVQNRADMIDARRYDVGIFEISSKHSILKQIKYLESFLLVSIGINKDFYAIINLYDMMFLPGCPSCTILGLKPTACFILVFNLHPTRINHKYTHNQQKPNKQANHAIQVVTIHLVVTRCHVRHVILDPMLRTSPRLHHQQPPTTG